MWVSKRTSQDEALHHLGKVLAKPIKELMKRSEIKVLVVDDEASQGKAIREVLKRAGYDPKWVASPDEAANISRQVDYKLAIVDCLLPRTNGIDLVAKLRANLGEDVPVVLISGIYKDKSFVKEALQKTRALHFLNKPFDLEKLLNLVDEAFADVLDADLPPLMSTLLTKEISSGDRQLALSEPLHLHGFELPLVYSLVFGSSISGELHVTSAEGDLSKLIFHKGELTNIVLKDSTSYFGVLLVEMGFTSPEEVDDVLEQVNETPIGERLVAAHSLSPHAIQLVRQEQMTIRLSKTVQDTFVEVKFIEQETQSSDVAVGRDRFTELCWDWICSKLSVEWLRQHYSHWLAYPVVLAEQGRIQPRFAALPGLPTELEPLLKLFAKGESLGEILENDQITDEKMLPILHLLLIEKLAYFSSPRASKEDFQKRISRLKRLVSESAQRDHFQVLGVNPQTMERDISKNYMELAKNFHPDRLDPGVPEELRRLTEQYFTRITQAYEVLKDNRKKADYARELRVGSAEKILLNESLFEQAQTYLRKGKYQTALDIFSKLAGQRGHRSDLFIYLTWAKMKVGAPHQKIEKFLMSISEQLNKVPPEDRHSAPYFYAKGLFNMQVGDLQKAKTNLKHALMIEPKFVEARRDLTVVRNRIRSAENTNLSTVVTRLFGRSRRR